MSEFKNCHKIYEGFLYFPLNEAKDGRQKLETVTVQAGSR